MVTFSAALWVALASIAAFAVLAVLGRLAAAVEDEKRAHDALVLADRLRRQYAAQLAAQQAQGEIIEVDVIEEGPGPADPRPLAA